MSRWQQFYRDDPRVRTAPPSRCVQRALTYFQHRHSQIVLDLGCGVGRDTSILLQHGLRVIGVDAATSGLQLASERLAHLHPTLIAADARQLPLLPAQVDGVYCFGLLHEFVGSSASADVAAVMRETKRVLRAGGLLILTTLAGAPDAGLPHVQLFTEAMFTAATAQFEPLEQGVEVDIGCTGSQDYRVWYGAFIRPEG